MKKLVDERARFPRKLADNLWVLGNYHFNLFLVKGASASALIELGISAITDAVIAQLDDLGITPDYLVMTHPHADHVTGLAGLRQRFPKAALITARGAGDFINHPKAQRALIAEDRFMSEALRAKGFSPQRPPIERMVLPDETTEVAQPARFDLGRISIDCIPVDGHSPGSLIVHIPTPKAVIAADALGFHFNGRCFMPLYFTDYDGFKSSLAKITSLRPSILGIGHQSPFTGETVGQALSASLNAATTLHAAIQEDGRPDEAIAQALFDENYRDEFRIYSPENIRNCCRLLVKRSRQAAGAGGSPPAIKTAGAV